MTESRPTSHCDFSPNSESGQSLVLALVVLFALSISIAGVFTFLTSNEVHFNRDGQDVRALAIAEAGLNNGLATVTKADALNNVAVGTTYTSGGPVQLDKGTFTYSATKQAAPNCTNALPTCWVVTATGTSPTGQVTHHCSSGRLDLENDDHLDRRVGRLRLWPLHQQSAGDANCFAISGGVTVKANVWFNGSFCPNGNASLTAALGSLYTVYIGGNYLGRNNTYIGRPPPRSRKPTSSGSARSRTRSRRAATRRTATSTRIPRPRQLVGVEEAGCQRPAGLHLRQRHRGARRPDRELERPDLFHRIVHVRQQHDDEWRSPADDALQRAKLLLHGQRQLWEHGRHTRLGQRGQDADCRREIFIDGDITFASSTDKYVGNGTIYVNGSLDGGGSFSGASICGPPIPRWSHRDTAALARWNSPTTSPPADGTGTLEFVFINPNNVSTPVNLQGSGHEWQVTLFVVKGFTSNGGTAILGPVLAVGGAWRATRA